MSIKIMDISKHFDSHYFKRWNYSRGFQNLKSDFNSFYLINPGSPLTLSKRYYQPVLKNLVLFHLKMEHENERVAIYISKLENKNKY